LKGAASQTGIICGVTQAVVLSLFNVGFETSRAIAGVFMPLLTQTNACL
jgi:hypothetical protein